MSRIELRRKFAEKYIRTKDGDPFTLEGRQWVIDELWLPSDGWKWWPIDNSALCDDCKFSVGCIVEYTKENPSQSEAHRATGCMGLDLRPIIVTAAKLPRGEGKSFNGAVLDLSDVCCFKNKSITFLANSEKQSDRIIDENYIKVIEQSPKLSELCHVRGNRIEVPSTRSFIEWITSAAKSATGGRRSRLRIDEARDVSREIVAAILPTINATNGIECPNGHVHAPMTSKAPGVCPACGADLVPWYGRLLITSSAGLLRGGEEDWFFEFTEELSANPRPNAHLYVRDESQNPKISKHYHDAMEVFASLPSMRVLMDIEQGNQFRALGEDFVTTQQLDLVVDKNFTSKMGSARRCVGFLDTSTVGDSTNLIILEEDPAFDPWKRLKVAHMKIWKPKDQPNQVIDPLVVQAYLDMIIPLFPALVDFGVDVRVMPWAVALVAECKKRPWGRKVEAFNGKDPERDAAWTILGEKILAREIMFPREVADEIRAVRAILLTDGRRQVRDRNRKKKHADVAESLAECCRRAHLQAVAAPRFDMKGLSKSQGAQLLNKIYAPVSRGLMREDGF